MQCCVGELYRAHPVAHLNYSPPLDNISIRPEFYDDMQGQRTGVKTRYADIGIGWPHWFSSQIEVRPEVVYDRSLDAGAFNGNPDVCPASANCRVSAIAPDKIFAWIASMDLTLHF